MTVGEYMLPVDLLGYESGTMLRDVNIREARSWECNGCGDCCDSSRPGVKKDEDTGLPLLVWGSNLPADRYEGRYGHPLLDPIAELDGELVVAADFDRDVNDRPWTSFKCRFLRPEGDGGRCALYGKEDPTGQDLSTYRPKNCGDFPVFGIEVDAQVADTGYYVPATGALPRCTWHGIRLTGPWKDEPAWIDRFEKQERGEAVPPLGRLPEGFVERLIKRRDDRRRERGYQ